MDKYYEIYTSRNWTKGHIILKTEGNYVLTKCNLSIYMSPDSSRFLLRNQSAICKKCASISNKENNKA